MPKRESASPLTVAERRRRWREARKAEGKREIHIAVRQQVADRLREAAAAAGVGMAEIIEEAVEGGEIDRAAQRLLERNALDEARRIQAKAKTADLPSREEPKE